MEAATKKRPRAAAPTTPHDDRDLALRLGALMMSTMSSGGGAAMQAIDDSGLNFAQIKVLATLAGRDDAEAATDMYIAVRHGISLASARRAVASLVKRPFATRGEDPDDRRIRRVSLTARGQEVAEELIAARLVGLETFVASLSPIERERLEAALEVLLQRDDIAEAYRTHRRRTRT